MTWSMANEKKETSLKKYLFEIWHYLEFAFIWALRIIWAILIPVFIAGVLFPKMSAWIYILLFLSLSLNAYFVHKDKKTLHLFRVNALPEKTKIIIRRLAVSVEIIFMFIATYILSKGLETITGVQEKIFGIPFIDLSLAMAIGIGLALFWLLFAIGNTYKRAFIVAYIILDLLILMPFNFMFIFEKNQNENLTAFHANELPILYSRVNKIYSDKFSDASKIADISTGYTEVLNKKDSSLKSEREDLIKKKSEADKNGDKTVSDYAARDIKRKEREIRINESKKNDTLNEAKKYQKDEYGLIVTELKRLRQNIDTIKKSSNRTSLFINVSIVKEALLSKIGDSLKKTDTAIARAVSVLQIKPQPPTEALLLLYKDIFSFSRWKGTTKDSLALPLSKTPDEVWGDKLVQLRWYSFSPSVLIDIIPLMIALFLGWMKKQENE
jgi:hypothetical protein